MLGKGRYRLYFPSLRQDASELRCSLFSRIKFIGPFAISIRLLTSWTMMTAQAAHQRTVCVGRCWQGHRRASIPGHYEEGGRVYGIVTGFLSLKLAKAVRSSVIDRFDR